MEAYELFLTSISTYRLTVYCMEPSAVKSHEAVTTKAVNRSIHVYTGDQTWLNCRPMKLLNRISFQLTIIMSFIDACSSRY